MTIYKVNEIFESLQGEGFFTGTAAVFLRFSGCNMCCDFCDTRHEEFAEMSAADIMRFLLSFKARHLVVTGGEPALQIDTPLINILHDEGFFIQIETNGSLTLPEGIDWVTCSPKSPSKGEFPKLALQKADELKLVYEGQDVEAVASQILARHYFLQPCSSDRFPKGSNTDETIDYILDHPWWRLSLQTHKLINIP